MFESDSPMVVNPPQPSDFGIPGFVIVDLQRLQGKAFKSFDHAWPRCKPYYSAWKQFGKAIESFRVAAVTSQVQFWCSLGAREFESYSAGLLKLLGYSATWVGGSDDKGIDVRAWDSSGLTVVQCKSYNRKIGPDLVRSLAGTMVAVGATRGWIFTIRGGSRGADEAVYALRAQGLDIALFTAGDLAMASLVSFYVRNPNVTKPQGCRSRIPTAS